MTYANFDRRLGALIIDFLILLPVLGLQLFLRSLSPVMAVIATIIGVASMNSYTIYFHARSGQTLGKKAMLIRVVQLDGSPMTWQKALLRSSVDLGLGILTIVAWIIVAVEISPSDYVAMTPRDRNAALLQVVSWKGTVDFVSQLWVSSEVIALRSSRFT